MKPPSKIEYIKALNNYYYKTKAHLFPTIIDKVEAESNTIQQYERHNTPFSGTEIIVKACMNFIARFLATIVFCVLSIYVLNEVLHMAIPYSAKNILLLTIIFFAYKTKFRLWREYVN